jgi:hypothetical protein
MAVLAISAGCLLAQNAADDPGGWTKAKWGMTQDEIKSAFPATGQLMDQGQTHLGLPVYVVDHRKYAVSFSFDKGDHLSYVHLIDQKTLVMPDGTERPMVQCTTCAPPAPDQAKQSKAERQKGVVAAATEAVVKAELNAQAAKGTKDSLLSALTEKYGNPTSHIADPEGTEHFEWLFPTTKITLLWFHSQFKNLDSTELFYSLRKKSSDL